MKRISAITQLLSTYVKSAFYKYGRRIQAAASKANSSKKTNRKVGKNKNANPEQRMVTLSDNSVAFILIEHN